MSQENVENDEGVNEMTEFFEGDHISILQIPPDNFVRGSIKPVTLDEENGITAMIGKLKHKSQEVVHTYLFKKDKWSVDDANLWIENYRKGNNSLFYVPLVQLMLNEIKEFKEQIILSKKILSHLGKQKIFNTSEIITKNAESESFVIGGIAIKEGVFNGIFFPATEILKAYQSLKGKPFTFDHLNSIFAAVGKITDVTFNAETNEVLFEAEVSKQEIIDILKENIINGVSIEVGGELNFDEENSRLFLTNMEFFALSLVLVPACSDCRITSMKEAKDDIMTTETTDVEVPPVDNAVCECLGRGGSCGCNANTDTIVTKADKVETPQFNIDELEERLMNKIPRIVAEILEATKPVVDDKLDETLRINESLRLELEAERKLAKAREVLRLEGIENDIDERLAELIGNSTDVLQGMIVALNSVKGKSHGKGSATTPETDNRASAIYNLYRHRSA